MDKIDAHQHFWSISRTDYGWLLPELGAIYRDFLPSDLAPLLTETGVARTILVQAAPSEAETAYLLDVAKHNSLVAGVVGWVNLEASNAAERVAYMAAQKVVGLRPMVQDIADTDWLLRPALQPAIDAMVANGLCFDALIQPRHLPRMQQFMAQYPELKVVIDHGAKPDIAHGALQPWADDIFSLASKTNVCCKLSGLVTEAGPDWQANDLRPYVAVLIDAFGPDRLMWGSDWPVLNLASDYSSWHSLTLDMLGDFLPEQRANIMGGNAARFYGI